jgi:hypothetical protein
MLMRERLPWMLVGTLCLLGAAACSDGESEPTTTAGGTGGAHQGGGGAAASGGTGGMGASGGTAGGQPTGGGGGAAGQMVKLLDVVRTADANGVRPGEAQAIPAMPGMGQARICWRVEVLSVPSTEVQGVQFCIWAAGWVPEGCSGGMDTAGAGVYSYEEPIDSWYTNGGMPDLSLPTNVSQAMFKVGSCCGGPLTVGPGGPCGAACYQGDLSPYVPRRARETAYMVPEGDSCPDLEAIAASTTPLDLD